MSYILDGKMHKLDTPEELTGFFADMLHHMSPTAPPSRYLRNKEHYNKEFGEDFFSQATGIYWYELDGSMKLMLKITYKDVLVPYEGDSIKSHKTPLLDANGIGAGTTTDHFAADKEFENTSNLLVNVDGQWMRVASSIPMLHGYSARLY